METQYFLFATGSGSALFIKTKNDVSACPLIKPPCIHFIFLKSSNILTNLIALKYIPYVHKGQKTNTKIVHNMCTNVWKCKK